MRQLQPNPTSLPPFLPTSLPPQPPFLPTSPTSLHQLNSISRVFRVSHYRQAYRNQIFRQSEYNQMARKIKKLPQPQFTDPLTFPISKCQSLRKNLKAFISMLHKQHSKIGSTSYVRYIHRYISKCRLRLKGQSPTNQFLEARQQIRICKACDGWSNKLRIINCMKCQDNYHIACLSHTNTDQFFCQHCEKTMTNLSSLNFDQESYLSKFVEEHCEKCKKEKNGVMLECMKCCLKFHRKCFGKTGPVCGSCCMQIESTQMNYAEQIKQTSLLDYYSPSKNQGSSPSKTSCEKDEKEEKVQKEEEYQKEEKEESTNANTTTHFNCNFPPLQKEEIEEYKRELIFSILTKKMKYVETLIPFECLLDDDTEDSLDFGMEHMNLQEYKVYLEYKKQPIGPFRLHFKQQMGYDVIADKDLPKGMLICQYIGDVISLREAVKRESKEKNDSIMELRAGKNADETLVIRPQYYTNIARFINGVNSKTAQHKANVETVRLLGRGYPSVLLFTKRAVKKGESLLYDYNAGGLNSYDTTQFV